MEESVRINEIKCFCYGCNEKVGIEATFERTENELINNVYTYFKCPRHGSVSAIVNGKRYLKPSDLFNKVTMEGET